MIRLKIKIPALLAVLLLFPFHVYASSTHLDKTKVASGCTACHKAHGKRGTPMLERSKDDLCFKCHGAGSKRTDIYSVIIKPSNHPVSQTSVYHAAGEHLPERDSALPRHVSCFDCHNVHISEASNSVKGMKGYSGRGAKIKSLTNEYELCYECHSDSANLPQNKNVSLDFLQSNASFHPVETYGKNTFVPSLVRGYNTSSLIKCSDCHGNDDISGPKGPHGSLYSPILSARYDRTTGAESPTSYGLCYKCHNRTSILNDESFNAHKVHIVFNQNSCAQCHVAHGSSTNRNLIGFDITVAFPNSKGEFAFLRGDRGKPRCLLSCHISGKVFEHKIEQPDYTNPSQQISSKSLSTQSSKRGQQVFPGFSSSQSFRYCINSKCPPGW